MNLIDPATLNLLGKALDTASLRQAVHANNIANAGAEGFAPSQVQFEQQLAQVREALARGQSPSEADLRGIEATVVPGDAQARVELDSEVAAMARNAMHYQALLKVLDRELSLMSLAVTDGRR